MKKSFKNEAWYFYALKKVFLIMRIVLFISLVCVMQTFALSSYTQNVRISLSAKEMKLEDILLQIENQSKYRFAYNKNEIDVNKKYSIDFKNVEIEKLLNELFSGDDINYIFIERQIVLMSSGGYSSYYQQGETISGKITDSEGKSLPGVTILVKGTSKGTISNAEGQYSLSNVPENAVLQFSFIGMKTKEIQVNENTTIDVSMEEETIGIEEVVAVGYGTVKKKDLTGAIAQISPKSYNAQPVQDVSEMLRGNAPGVVVKTNGDGSTKIRIRGYNSLNGDNDPLYIVDGVPMGSYSPNDVESIEVLKDASATAIYGSRGANGVILITTKRGKIGEPTVEVSATTSFATYPKFYDLLNGSEFADFYNSYFGRSVDFDNSVDTDWQRVTTQTGIRQNYQANVSGGTEKMKFYAGGNYIDNTGLIKNQSSKSYRLRSNFDFKLGARFSGRVDLSAKQDRYHGASVTGKGPLFSALQWAPCVPLYDEDGEYIITDPYGITTYVSPYYEIMEGNNNTYSTNVTANGYFAYEVISGLKISAQPSVTKSISEDRNFTNEILSSSGLSTAKRYSSNTTTWQLTGLAIYDKVIALKHNLNAMLGTEIWETENNNFTATAQDVSYDYMLWYNLGSSDSQEVASGYSGAQLASFFARANYNYDSKYYVTASIRADGSSKFKDDNQFSYFPSGALSWVASNENFLKDNRWLDYLKLRTSYGETGSQAIGSYETIAALRNRRYWSWGTGDRVQGVELNAPANSDLKWEETTQWDLGIDAAIFEKWSVTLDYYHKVTDGLLTKRQLPEYAGSGSTLINLGEMLNQGIDASVTYSPFKTKNFSWRMTFNASWLTNEVVSLGEIGEYFIPDDDSNFTGVQLEGSPLIVQEGESLGQMYGYRWLGLWSTSEAEEAAKYNQQPGDNKYLDKNNNYEYDNEDREVLGSFMPKFNWSYNTTINWKNFDFNLLVEGAHGQDMYNYNRMVAGTVVGMSGSVNLREAAENIWSSTNQNSMWSPNSTSALEKANSSKWVESADWAKVRNISIGYTIPKGLLGGHEFRINTSIQNVLTISGYSGMDPEAAVNGGKDTDIYGGVEYGTYPSPRVFTVGLTYKY